MTTEGFRVGGTPGDLFKGTARDYSEHRHPYPPEVIDHLVEIGGLNGTGRLLDCGCGTGQLFLPLAKHFQEVTAIDPDPDMIEFANRQISAVGLKNIILQQMRAEEISSELGQFQMIAFGASFHWTDRQRVGELVYDRLLPGGFLISINPPGIYNQPTPWGVEIKRIIDEFLGPTRRAGSGTYSQGVYHEVLLEKTRFAGCVDSRHIVIDEWWSIDRIVGWLFSSSHSSRFLLGDAAEDFERKIREVLHPFAEAGVIKRTIDYTITQARKA